MNATCYKSRDRFATVDIAALARARLAAHPYRQLHEIDCECHEGLLSLRGVVTTFYLKQLAQAALAGLSGVCEIQNQIEVRSTPVALDRVCE